MSGVYISRESSSEIEVVGGEDRETVLLVGCGETEQGIDETVDYMVENSHIGQIRTVIK